MLVLNNLAQRYINEKGQLVHNEWIVEKKKNWCLKLPDHLPCGKLTVCVM